MRSPILVFAFFLTGLTAASAQQAASPIEVSHAWIRATAGASPNGAAYVTIINHGAGDDKLIGAATPIAEKVELNSTVDEGGIMKMRPLSELDVKAGATTVLKPGGNHIMLYGLKDKLAAGGSFPLTLTFEKAGAVQTSVMVEKLGGSEKTAPDKSMPGMKM